MLESFPYNYDKVKVCFGSQNKLGPLNTSVVFETKLKELVQFGCVNVSYNVLVYRTNISLA